MKEFQPICGYNELFCIDMISLYSSLAVYKSNMDIHIIYYFVTFKLIYL